MTPKSGPRIFSCISVKKKLSQSSMTSLAVLKKLSKSACLIEELTVC